MSKIYNRYLRSCFQVNSGEVIFFSLSFQVTDSKEHVLYKKEDATKGKFAFTTEDYEMYKICFYSEGTIN